MEDDDIAMCGEGTGSINAKEKEGYVKEYIETEGLAMILSKVHFYGLLNRLFFIVFSHFVNNGLISIVAENVCTFLHSVALTPDSNKDILSNTSSALFQTNSTY